MHMKGRFVTSCTSSSAIRSGAQHTRGRSTAMQRGTEAVNAPQHWACPTACRVTMVIARTTAMGHPLAFLPAIHPQHNACALLRNTFCTTFLSATNPARQTTGQQLVPHATTRNKDNASHRISSSEEQRVPLVFQCTKLRITTLNSGCKAWHINRAWLLCKRGPWTAVWTITQCSNTHRTTRPLLVHLKEDTLTFSYAHQLHFALMKSAPDLFLALDQNTKRIP